MLQEEVQRIVNEVAKENGMDGRMVERAFKNQFQVVRDAITSSYDRKDYPVIYIKYLGKFIPHKKYISLRDKFRDAKKIEGNS